jgi:hypothetical protein
MPPDGLARVQGDLFARITGLAVGDAGRAAAEVVGDGRASAEERLDVYATMYRLRIAEALESQFPRVARAMGADAFGQEAVAYVGDVPSRHPSLREVGRGFPDWLAARPAPAVDLAALARLEWARVDVFDLAEQPVLAIEALRAVSPERFAELPLRLVGAHRLIDVGAATLELWNRLREAGDGGEIAPAVDAAGGVLVWRQDVTVYHRGLARAERDALDAVARGTTFGAVCEGLAAGRSDEEAAAQAFAWLSTWALDGLLADPG